MLSVRRIFVYYKKYGYKTIVMGASFQARIRSCIEGRDRLTIGPEVLRSQRQYREHRCQARSHRSFSARMRNYLWTTFRWMMCKDAMATEKLAEGIRKFAVISLSEKFPIIPS